MIAPTADVAVSRNTRFSRGRGWVAGWVLVGLVVASAAVYVIDQYWPYRYENVKPLLENVFASKITIDHYSRTYFPRPGFVATELTLRRNEAPDLPPIGTTRNLIVEGRWTDLLLLRKSVWLVDVTGLHVVLPPVGTRAHDEDFPPGSSEDFAGPTTLVEKLHVRDSLLEIEGKGATRYSLPIHELTIENLQRGRTVSYSVEMENAKPAGKIRSSGTFGPLNPQNLGSTALSGDVKFSGARLQDFGQISGELTAEGHFQGRLADIEAQASSLTPDFAVGRGRPTAVSATMRARIDGLNGDVVIHEIEAKIGATSVRAEGSVVGSPKTTTLDIAVSNGRSEDLLRPFLKDEVPLTGSAALRAHAFLAPSGEGRNFLQRLRVDGSFDAPSEMLTNTGTEQHLSAFSKRAASKDKGGKEPLNVRLSLAGPVSIRNGILTTPRAVFSIPGASADLHGDYNLSDKTVHMTGDLAMQSNISHITTGIKSWMLVPFIPFFKKDGAGAVIPVAVTGRPGQYKVSQNLLHSK